ncbi:AAA family ATPase, partial [Micromonospora sp. NPDC004336]
MGNGSPRSTPELSETRNSAKTATMDRLVGRSAETRLLREACDRNNVPMCATIVLYGDPGIGKTELLREFGEFAAEVGLRVVRGRGNGDGRPFGTAGDLVEDCFRTVGTAAWGRARAGGNGLITQGGRTKKNEGGRVLDP